jgi:hypothetical protein
VTVPLSYEVEFEEKLSQRRIMHQRIGLDGHFHSPIHEAVVTRLKEVLISRDDMRLPQAGTLRLPLRSTSDTEITKAGCLTDIALDVTLCKSAHWFQTVKRAMGRYENPDRPVQVVPIGRSCRIPRSISHHTPEANGLASALPAPAEEIAVVGVACRFPQADNLEEFWKLIETGSCCVTGMPHQRFDTCHVARGPKLSTYYGNFLREPAAFDHRFFGMSGREAKSMDPQQRLTLQIAYEALESSGYYSKPEEGRENDVGVYLGVGAVDYESNIASEDAGAFSATGVLRAFISGRVSHFFGWSGPSITFDTACSSSAVAIHSACRVSPIKL